MTSDSPRQWTLTWRETDKPGVKAWVCSGPVLPGDEPMLLVEESRLREVEAERDKLEARAELLEAELREAGDTFSELAIYLHPDEGQTHNADACGVDACIFCLAETRAEKARERARGVLRKGDTGAG